MKTRDQRRESVERDTVYWNGSLRSALFPVNSISLDDPAHLPVNHHQNETN